MHWSFQLFLSILYRTFCPLLLSESMLYITARLFEVEVGLGLLPDTSYKMSSSAITNVHGREELVH